MFWSDTVSNIIYRASLDGTGGTILIRTGSGLGMIIH